MANLERNWESAREAIFHSVVCSFAPPSSPMLCCKCNRNEAMLRCRQCGIIQYLCVACDEEVHQCQPRHDREIWFNGYFQYILPTQSVSEDRKLICIGMYIRTAFYLCACFGLNATVYYIYLYIWYLAIFNFIQHLAQFPRNILLKKKTVLQCCLSYLKVCGTKFKRIILIYCSVL